MELDDLRGFLAVAKAKNLTSAARDLGLTQSTLSRRIQRLESALGQPLFERTSRAMELTDAGTGFVESARLVVSVLDRAAEELRDAPNRGVVRVGAIPTIAPYLLPRVLTAFAASFPGVAVTVRESTTDVLLAACREGEVDIAVLAEPTNAAHLESRVLRDEELLLLLPAQHRLADERTVALRQIKDEPVVLLNGEHCLTEAVGAFCRERSFEPVSVAQVHQLSMLQELVGLGHGVSLVPAMAAEHDASPRRVYRRLAGRAPSRTIVAIRNPYRYQKQVARSFWDLLGEPARWAADSPGSSSSVDERAADR